MVWVDFDIAKYVYSTVGLAAGAAILKILFNLYCFSTGLVFKNWACHKWIRLFPSKLSGEIFKVSVNYNINVLDMPELFIGETQGPRFN